MLYLVSELRCLGVPSFRRSQTFALGGLPRFSESLSSTLVDSAPQKQGQLLNHSLLWVALQAALVRLVTPFGFRVWDQIARLEEELSMELREPILPSTSIEKLLTHPTIGELRRQSVQENMLFGGWEKPCEVPERSLEYSGVICHLS
jgi:hypothetical protein